MYVKYHFSSLKRVIEHHFLPTKIEIIAKYILQDISVRQILHDENSLKTGIL